MNTSHRSVFLILAVLGLLAVSGCEAQSQWETLDPMPMGVLSAGISRSGDLAVITGGVTQDSRPSRAVQVLDLHTLQWREPTLRMPTGRFFHGQVTLPDQRILVIAGNTARATQRPQLIDDCLLIDLTAGAVYPAAPLPQPAYMLTAHLLDDGQVAAVAGQHVYVYDPAADQWQQAATLEHPRLAHASVVLQDGRIVVIGGVRQDSIEVVDLDRQTTRLLETRLPFPLDDHRAAVLPDGRVWIVGGQNSRTGDTTGQTWVLHLDSSNQAKLIAGPRLGILDGVADHCLVATDRWLVVIGGESQQSGRDTELQTARLLDPHTLAVHVLPDTQVPHDDAVAIATGDQVIVFGGFWEMPLLGLDQRVPVAVREVERLKLR